MHCCPSCNLVLSRPVCMPANEKKAGPNPAARVHNASPQEQHWGHTLAETPELMDLNCGDVLGMTSDAVVSSNICRASVAKAYRLGSCELLMTMVYHSEYRCMLEEILSSCPRPCTNIALSRPDPGAPWHERASQSLVQQPSMRQNCLERIVSLVAWQSLMEHFSTQHSMRWHAEAWRTFRRLVNMNASPSRPAT